MLSIRWSMEFKTCRPVTPRSFAEPGGSAVLCQRSGAEKF
jgi:hypothetical protein